MLEVQYTTARVEMREGVQFEDLRNLHSTVQSILFQARQLLVCTEYICSLAFNLAHPLTDVVSLPQVVRPS